MKTIFAIAFLCLLVGVNAQSSPLDIECGTSTVLSFNTGQGADLAMTGAGDVIIHGHSFFSDPNAVFVRAFQGAFTFFDHVQIGTSTSKCDGIISYESNFGSLTVAIDDVRVPLTASGPVARSVKMIDRTSEVTSAEQKISVGTVDAEISSEGIVVNGDLVLGLTKPATGIRMVLVNSQPIIAFTSEQKVAVIHCFDAECSSVSLSATDVVAKNGEFSLTTTGEGIMIKNNTSEFRSNIYGSAIDVACNGATAGTIHNIEGQLFACSAVHTADSATSSVYQWSSLAGHLHNYF